MNAKMFKQGKYLGSKKERYIYIYIYIYEILVTGPLCTSECAGECRLSANLFKRVLDVSADVILEATRNADMLTINASEDFQKLIKAI